MRYARSIDALPVTYHSTPTFGQPWQILSPFPVSQWDDFAKLSVIFRRGNVSTNPTAGAENARRRRHRP